MTGLALLTAPLRLRGRHERREAAGEAEADTFVRDLRDTRGDTDALERLADTDVRRYYTLPPAVRRDPLTPRPYVAEQCWCGGGRRYGLACDALGYVREALHHDTTGETVEADSLLMQALTPDVLATLDAEASQ